ncbi:hypothetical protein PPYR_07280 [Photinus pyralis]|uniref:type I protein arginine methyltransferase n=2 Tax=Photinus pyralis TaxID=7054 RepID=A0A5N4APZ5_PHOPY|nr:protein arginine N-methyltransferase 1-like [Photinus pyralis]KAB0799400.1 hypothetical protein PPYR_07280 [Photinus pyralis]
MTETEDTPTLCEGDDNDDSDGWDEMEVSGEQTTCLFCPSQFLTIAVALDHCRSEHKFDLLELKTKYNMDCYSFIKMINYIRLHKPDPHIITESCVALWEDDVYLKPGEMEPWLMYDFDDLGSTPSTPHYAIDGKTPISNNINDLQRQIYELTLQVREKDNLLKSAMQDMAKMREVTKTIVESGDSKVSLPTSVASVPVGYDNEYFNTYAHYGIHHEMLSDTVRTTSYRDAILNNKDVFKGKIALDVGCGTAILSMFAAQAGSAKVYGIDQSDVLYKAMDIIRENNLQDVVHLIRGRIEDTPLPVDKVDIIISEWMGYFLLFEGMLDSFIYARDNHLSTNGVILPNRCNISLIGISDLDKYDKHISFWNNVYGFSMKCMKSEVVKEPNVETISSDTLITSPFVLTEIDLKTCQTNTVEFSTDFKLQVVKGGILTALGGYFDTFFDLPISVSFSTGPHVTKTHWQQTVFYLKNPRNVSEGDTIEGNLKCARIKKNVRGLKVTITMDQETQEYLLD